MKKSISLFFFTLTTAFLPLNSTPCKYKEQEKTLSIIDVRHKGLHHSDSTTAGFSPGEVAIYRTLILKPKWDDEHKDTMNTYDVHFFKMFENKLRNYSLMYGDETDFNKATYKWLNDTIVSVTLLNSDTNQSHNLKLSQTFEKGASAGILPDNWK